MKSVGAIEDDAGTGFGTAWILRENYIVTNEHVANIFFSKNYDTKEYDKVHNMFINFSHGEENEEDNRYEITECIIKKAKIDLAILKVQGLNRIGLESKIGDTKDLKKRLYKKDTRLNNKKPNEAKRPDDNSNIDQTSKVKSDYDPDIVEKIFILGHPIEFGGLRNPPSEVLEVFILNEKKKFL